MNIMNTLKCALFVTAPLTMGCITGQAQIWSQDQQGGVMALDGDETKATQDANAKMSAHCGFNNWYIVRRETVTVGQEQYSNSNTNYGEETDSVHGENTNSVQQGNYGSSNTQGGQSSVTQGGSNTSSVAGTRDVNQIRMHYRCGQPPMPAQGQPPVNYPQAQPAPQAPAQQPYPQEPPPNSNPY